jgi:hypothetical protein
MTQMPKRRVGGNPDRIKIEKPTQTINIETTIGRQSWRRAISQASSGA